MPKIVDFQEEEQEGDAAPGREVEVYTASGVLSDALAQIAAARVQLTTGLPTNGTPTTGPPMRESDLEWKALQRAFELRRALLNDAITTTEVAALLGISRQAARERGRKGQLLSVKEGGKARFPLWQFDPAGSGGVVEGLSRVLRALDETGALSPLAKMSWLSKANASLGGATPLEVLKSGRLAEVLSAARAAGAS